MDDDRNWDDPKYKDARMACLKRDKFTCRFPGCKSKKKLNTHHIERWADNHEKRYLLSNLITLCGQHHKQITGHESEYVVLFHSIISGGELLVQMIYARYAKK